MSRTRSPHINVTNSNIQMPRPSLTSRCHELYTDATNSIQMPRTLYRCHELYTFQRPNAIIPKPPSESSVGTNTIIYMSRTQSYRPNVTNSIISSKCHELFFLRVQLREKLLGKVAPFEKFRCTSKV